MFFIVLGRNVSILIESFLGPSKNTDPYLAVLKCAVGSPTLTFLLKIMYKINISLFSYCTIRTLISIILTGTYKGAYMYIFEMCCYRTLDIVIYIVANYKWYISVKKLKTLKNYAVMLRLLSDTIPMLILYSWRTFRLLSPVSSGWTLEIRGWLYNEHNKVLLCLTTTPLYIYMLTVLFTYDTCTTGEDVTPASRAICVSHEVGSAETHYWVTANKNYLHN